LSVKEAYYNLISLRSWYLVIFPISWILIFNLSINNIRSNSNDPIYLILIIMVISEFPHNGISYDPPDTVVAFLMSIHGWNLHPDDIVNTQIDHCPQFEFPITDQFCCGVIQVYSSVGKCMLLWSYFREYARFSIYVRPHTDCIHPSSPAPVNMLLRNMAFCSSSIKYPSICFITHVYRVILHC